MNNHQPIPPDDHVIFRYTRAQAIDDGVLIDLTPWARETGFRVPVACTHTVWQRYVAPPEGTESLGQSARGRAHDLLWMLLLAIKRQRADNEDAQQLTYEALFLDARGRHEKATLKAVMGPGDQAEPVLTILMPDED